MHHLTGNPSPAYTAPTANALAVGFDSLNGQDNGAQAPSNSFLGVFFVLEKDTSKGFPLVVCGGKPSGLPVIAVGVHRSVNPSHAATILFDSDWCQLVLDQTQDTNMNTIFQLRKDVTPSQLSNALYENAIQACALNDVLGEHLSNRSELPEDHYYEKTAQLQWALAGLLEQQRVVSDRLVMQRICHGEFEVGEAV